MKVYLDDTRETPEGWTRCYWPEEVIDLLKSNPVEELSLDHDLGEDGLGGRTGYDVLMWIEEQCYTTAYMPPKKIWIHSANCGAWKKMELAIQQIQKISQQKQTDSERL